MHTLLGCSNGVKARADTKASRAFRQLITQIETRRALMIHRFAEGSSAQLFAQHKTWGQEGAWPVLVPRNPPRSDP